jgi:hypothetical protein
MQNVLIPHDHVYFLEKDTQATQDGYALLELTSPVKGSPINNQMITVVTNDNESWGIPMIHGSMQSGTMFQTKGWAPWKNIPKNTMIVIRKHGIHDDVKAAI